MSEITDAVCVQRLAEAQAALHALQTGTQEVLVHYADRRVQFTPANVDKLIMYIRELESQCGVCKKRRRPFGVVW